MTTATRTYRPLTTPTESTSNVGELKIVTLAKDADYEYVVTERCDKRGITVLFAEKGTRTTYTCRVAYGFPVSCDCAGWYYRSKCKHTDLVVKLNRENKI